MSAQEEKEPRSLAQNGIYFAAMVGFLVFANWARPEAGDTGVWAAIFAAKWYLAIGFLLMIGGMLVERKVDCDLESIKDNKPNGERMGDIPSFVPPGSTYLYWLRSPNQPTSYRESTIVLYFPFGLFSLLSFFCLLFFLSSLFSL